MKRRNWKRIFGITLAVMMLFVGCGSQSGSTAQTEGNAGETKAENAGETQAAESQAKESQAADSGEPVSITIISSEDGGTMNPLVQMSPLTKRMYDPILETVFKYDEDMNCAPVLADSWEIDEDGLGITLTIKKGVKFHDGTELKASDIKFSLQYMASTSYKSTIEAFDTDNIELIDDYTLHIPCTEVVGPLIDYFVNVYVFSEAYVNEVGVDALSTQAMGTGPFTQGEWVSGDHFTLNAFEDYHGGKPAVDQITIRFISEASVAMIELESGNADIVLDPLGTDVAKVESGEAQGIKTHYGKEVQSQILYFNCDKAPMNDINVRKAVAYAIDNEAIITAAYDGVGDSAHSHISRGSFGYDTQYTDNDLYARNVETAKKLLSDAGYADGLTLSLVANNDTAVTSACEVLINMLSEVGITLDVQQYDTATVSDISTNEDNWDIFYNSYFMSGDPLATLQLCTASSNGVIGGSNYSRNKGLERADEYDQILLEASKTTDSAARAKLYGDLQAINLDQMWIYPIRNTGNIALMADYIDGYWVSGARACYEKITVNK